MGRRRNLLLITVDSLRADHVYGDRVATPTFDGLANEGTTYSRAFAQGPFTTFSMPSLFTSRYPSSLQYLEFSDATVGVSVGGKPTLTERLQESGYVTAGFHSNPLLSKLFGFDRGFDTFDARLPFSGIDVLPGRVQVLADKVLRLVRKHAYLPAERVTKRGLSWIDERHSTDRPFFLWLHYMDVHGPYQAKSGSDYLNKFRGERLWRKAITNPSELTDEERDRLDELYRAEIRYTDKWIGRLLDGLRERGLSEGTTTIVTADHGEAFGERGVYSHPHQPYDELSHVPLLAENVAGTDETGGTVDRVVELLDVAPTLLAEAGVDPPDSFRGRVLPGHPQSGNERAETAMAVTETDLSPEYVGSVRMADWRYVEDRISGTTELHDCTADPDARRDVSDRHSDVVEDLADRLTERVSGVLGGPGSVEQADVTDAGTRDRLRNLGYLK